MGKKKTTKKAETQPQDKDTLVELILASAKLPLAKVKKFRTAVEEYTREYSPTSKVSRRERMTAENLMIWGAIRQTQRRQGSPLRAKCDKCRQAERREQMSDEDLFKEMYGGINEDEKEQSEPQSDIG